MNKIIIIILLFLSQSFKTFSQEAICNLILTFDNVINDTSIVIKDKTYKNAKGENFNITKLQYYVSNIKLLKTDNSYFIVPQDSSYFLIRENDSLSKKLLIKNIPCGIYQGIEFIVGVDSSRNTMDLSQRKGCLDVGAEAQDMYWVWNSGYIFFKLEGNSNVLSAANPKFMYHIGLFGGIGQKQTINNIRTIQVGFSDELSLQSVSKNQIIIIKADISKIFDGINMMSIAQNPVIMGAENSAKVADNYQKMFYFSSFE